MGDGRPAWRAGGNGQQHSYEHQPPPHRSVNDQRPTGVTGAAVTGGQVHNIGIPLGPRLASSLSRLVALWVVVASALTLTACSDPTPLTATVVTSATRNSLVGAGAQLVVTVTNSGPLIPQLGLVFMTTDRWYEHHTVTAEGACTIAADASAFDCGDLAAGATASFVFAGVAKDAGTFHYELALRELVRPFDFVNDHPDGADVEAWDETIAAR